MRRGLLSIIIALCLLAPSAAFAGEVPWPFVHLGNDFKYTFAGVPMFLIGAGGIAAAEFTQLDQNVANHFRGNPISSTFDKWGDLLGSPYVIDGGSLLTWGIAELAGAKKFAMTGEALVEALAITEGTALAVKGIFRRTRPNGGNYSFFSGHAARTFAMAAVLEGMHGPAAGIPAFLFAAAISFSRIDKDVHYLSDVVFGAAWGAAIGWGTALYHEKLRSERFMITPTCAGNPGLGFIYLF